MEIDWNNDEAVVKAVFPESYLTPRGVVVFIKDGEPYGGHAGDWAGARRFLAPEIQAFESQHRPVAQPMEQGTEPAGKQEVRPACALCKKPASLHSDLNGVLWCTADGFAGRRYRPTPPEGRECRDGQQDPDGLIDVLAEMYAAEGNPKERIAYVMKLNSRQLGTILELENRIAELEAARGAVPAPQAEPAAEGDGLWQDREYIERALKLADRAVLIPHGQYQMAVDPKLLLQMLASRSSLPREQPAGREYLLNVLKRAQSAIFTRDLDVVDEVRAAIAALATES